MRIQIQLRFLASLVLVIDAGPILQTAKNDKDFAIDYLTSFYNLRNVQDVKSATSQRTDLLTEKIKEMQRFFKLDVTGNLDNKTLEVMRSPRCGVPDVVPFSTFTERMKWRTNRLTYSIVNYTPDLSRAEVDQSIDKALQLWARYTPLRFTRIYSDTADIKISFSKRYHGDAFPFDGPHGILAHAFPPSAGLGGDAHFDDDEIFTLRSPRGFVLFLVAAHEFGHSLGLSHSMVPGALMYPAYVYRDPDRFYLPTSDIREIQSLYGPNRDLTPFQPNACDRNLILDAVTTFRGGTVFFKDSSFWRSIPGRKVEQLPIKRFWLNGPDRVDAAYEDPVLNKVVFFKDRQVWAFYGSILERGYPKALSSFGLSPAVRKVSAAVHDRNTGRTLLFTDHLYYSYNERMKRMDPGFPKSVQYNFAGISGEVTAAHLSRSHIVLFNGRKVFEYKPTSKKLVQVLTNNDFLPC